MSFEIRGAELRRDQTVRLSDFKGKVRIVDFWATWGPPCRAEIPHFQALYEKYQKQGMVVVGIALDQEGAEAVQPFVESVGMTYPVLLGDARTAQAYGGVPAIPTTFVIDRGGRIYRKYEGYQERAVFEKDVQELLKEG
jgi:thiol-disulfide isomerase/thioredoxin